MTFRRKSGKKKKIIKKKKSDIKHILDDFPRTKIRIIGIGGGAGSIVSEIASRIKKADFVVANTDSRALKTIKKAKRFQFGESITHGLGTGMNVELGESSAEEDKERIKNLFSGKDFCIIIACLGGGSGSGAAPLFAKFSKSSGCLTYGIFTLPFEFEGEKKMEIAKEALSKVRVHLNAFSVIPNERIFQIIDKNTPLKEALSAINKRLAENLEGLFEMIFLPGLINIDFADLRTIFGGRGRLAYLNSTEIDELKEEEAIKKLISTPLYSYNIKGARGILYNIVGGRSLQLSEVSKISELISESVNKNAKIIFGISQNSKYKNKIKITLLATGCVAKEILKKPAKEVKPKKKKSKKRPKKEKLKKNIVSQKIKERTPIQKIEKRVKSVMALAKKKKPLTIPEIKKPKIEINKREKIKTKTTLLTKPASLEKKSVLPKRTEKPIVQKKTVPLVKKQKTSTFTKKVVKKTKKPIFSGSRIPSLINKRISKKKVIPKETSEVKIRRNALQLRKAIEEEEKRLLEKEKFWETPAILRKKKNNEQLNK